MIARRPSLAAALVAAHLLLTGTRTALAGEAAAPPSIGANLNAIADWSRDNTFVDLVKQGRPFGSPDSPWDLAAPVGADGWPTGDAGIVLLIDLAGLPGYGGTYRLSVTCEVEPNVALVASPGSLGNVAYDARSGRLTADIEFPEGGSQLMVQVTGTQGHGFRDLRVIRPGYDPAIAPTFTTQFLAHVERFDTLRFIHWTNTNWNPTSTWAERTRPEAPTYAGSPGGVPWEVCIDLCNVLDKDAWITVPHLADDEYLANLADLVRDRLEPGRTLWLEWSNEVWNWGYGQTAWNLAQAEAEVANDPACDLNYDGVNNPGYWAARRIARRIMEVGAIFRERFGEAAFEARVRPVLAHQIGWPALWLHEGLRYLDANHGHPAEHLHAVAGAPYVNLGAVNFDPAMTPDMVLDALEAEVDALRDNAIMEYNAFEARWYGLPFVAYEGGPDTAGENGIAAKATAGHDPRMGALCKELLHVWFGYGFGHFDWFQAGASNWLTPWGTFTLTDDMSDQATPKILALDEVIAEPTPPPVEGRPMPGTFDARRHVSRPADWEVAEPYWQFIGLGHERDYLLRCTDARSCRLRLVAGSFVGGSMTILADGAELGTVTIPDTGGQWGSSSAIVTALPPGMHALRLRSNSNYLFSVQSVVSELLGDLNGDGSVDAKDLATMLGGWGGAAGDLDGNGTTDAGDLALLLGNWG